MRFLKALRKALRDGLSRHFAHLEASMTTNASLRSRLRTALLAGNDLSEVLKFGDSRPLCLADATELCEFLAEQTDIHRLIDTEKDGPYHTPLYYLVMALQADTDKETTEHLRDHGLPELLRLCDLALAEPDPPDHPLTMMAKMFAMYSYEPGVGRVATIARRFTDSYMLSVSFGMYGDERHPHGPALIALLREPLPAGFSGVLTLDLANTLCRQKRLKHHPFDTPDGHQRLESWLARSGSGTFQLCG